MCIRCGTGAIAWCTDPDRHGEIARRPEVSPTSVREVIGTLTDLMGREIEFAVQEHVVVIDCETPIGRGRQWARLVLDAAGQEEFAQLYVAACHQAKVNAAQAVSS